MEEKTNKIQLEDNSKKAVKTSFFQAIANRLKKQRLGDLLLSAGLISENDLETALAEQKATKEQIGKILVRNGAISPILLYRKLAEQWCIKASTIGLTLMVGTVSMPNIARANSQQNNKIILASVVNTTAYSSVKVRYPSLFRTKEIKSNDVSSFSKWTGMLNRFEKQLASYSTSGSSPRLQMWKKKLSSLQNKDVAEQITAVNEYINKVKYISDKNNWGKGDYWATPIEFFSRGGDCEDYAIAKYASLKALGMPTERMRIAIVRDMVKNIHHALLIVYAQDGNTYVLDNQVKATKKLQNVTRYKPIFSINQKSWWLHKSLRS